MTSEPGGTLSDELVGHLKEVPPALVHDEDAKAAATRLKKFLPMFQDDDMKTMAESVANGHSSENLGREWKEMSSQLKLFKGKLNKSELNNPAAAMLPAKMKDIYGKSPANANLDLIVCKGCKKYVLKTRFLKHIELCAESDDVKLASFATGAAAVADANKRKREISVPERKLKKQKTDDGLGSAGKENTMSLAKLAKSKSLEKTMKKKDIARKIDLSRVDDDDDDDDDFEFKEPIVEPRPLFPMVQRRLLRRQNTFLASILTGTSDQVQADLDRQKIAIQTGMQEQLMKNAENPPTASKVTKAGKKVKATKSAVVKMADGMPKPVMDTAKPAKKTAVALGPDGQPLGMAALGAGPLKKKITKVKKKGVSTAASLAAGQQIMATAGAQPHSMNTAGYAGRGQSLGVSPGMQAGRGQVFSLNKGVGQNITTVKPGGPKTQPLGPGAIAARMLQKTNAAGPADQQQQQQVSIHQQQRQAFERLMAQLPLEQRQQYQRQFAQQAAALKAQPAYQKATPQQQAALQAKLAQTRIQAAAAAVAAGRGGATNMQYAGRGRGTAQGQQQQGYSTGQAAAQRASQAIQGAMGRGTTNPQAAAQQASTQSLYQTLQSQHAMAGRGGAQGAGRGVAKSPGNMQGISAAAAGRGGVMKLSPAQQQQQQQQARSGALATPAQLAQRAVNQQQVQQAGRGGMYSTQGGVTPQTTMGMAQGRGRGMTTVLGGVGQPNSTINTSQAGRGAPNTASRSYTPEQLAAYRKQVEAQQAQQRAQAQGNATTAAGRGYATAASIAAMAGRGAGGGRGQPIATSAPMAGRGQLQQAPSAATAGAQIQRQAPQVAQQPKQPQAQQSQPQAAPRLPTSVPLSTSQPSAQTIMQWRQQGLNSEQITQHLQAINAHRIATSSAQQQQNSAQNQGQR